MRNAYLHCANINVSFKRLRNFCIKQNKMAISEADRMLIKVLTKRKVTVQRSY